MNAKVTYGLWYDFRNSQPWRMPFEAFYAERLAQIAENVLPRLRAAAV